ncbi:hypothetical protein EYF80_017462 [Liparis tanakae]|uniref:Uncharacterized protein n=1 Tax=Liparis tanakae TaxID=230148 RepID=A0A4Z2I3B6_9TELE|nr:hypothetical protein EYF80_017462 [Liparis tanakae]
MWAFRLPFCAVLCSQYGHLYGFSRVCLLMCCDRELSRGKLRPQTPQVWPEASSAASAFILAEADQEQDSKATDR